MFKSALLLTTAFMAAGSTAFVAAHSGAFAQEQLQGSANFLTCADKNAEFLQHYGFAVCLSKYDSSCCYVSHSDHIAVPVVGSGKEVSAIIVKNRLVRDGVDNHTFSVDILRSTPSGLPGDLLVGGTGRVTGKWRRIKVPVSRTLLRRGKLYWVEEFVTGAYSWTPHEILWASDSNRVRDGYQQSRTYHSSSASQHSSTTPWMKLTGRPYVRLKQTGPKER